ncbi:alpha/beta hydrolase [Pseudoxanthomonas sp. PXM02]|uniref:serine aminopeptidase domain-containing protein n=1 Tax=Pseudoxanthomonas sp. PXM02 TaxID=2769294 RepID=UPI00177B6F8B
MATLDGRAWTAHGDPAAHGARKVVHMVKDVQMVPAFFGPQERRLFGVRHLPAEGVRAALLMCPPLLHEQMRSYRFFSQVASQLAGAGIACLRFDYYGTGDSEGDDGQFRPEATTQDLTLAAAELQRIAPDVPLIVMGARASALFAWRDAAALGASALWLWQPVVDGERYVQTLVARDNDERASNHRYPLLKGKAPAMPDDLMGFRLSPGAREALASLTLEGPGPGLPLSVVDTADGEGRAITADAHLTLPATLSAWTNEIDLDGLIPLRDARDALEGLLARLAKGGARG